MVVTRGETNSDWKQSMAYLAQMMLCPVVVVYVHPIDISGVYDNIFETIITDKEKAKCPILYADTKTIVKAMDAIGEITHETYNFTIDDFSSRVDVVTILLESVKPEFHVILPSFFSWIKVILSVDACVS